MTTIWKNQISFQSVIRQAYRLHVPKIISTLILAFFLLQLSSFRADFTLVTITEPRVEISGASGEMIIFRTQNGKEAAGNPSQTHSIPHLVLQRNGSLTHPSERRLSIDVNGLPVPASGAAISLEVSTQHTTQAHDHGISRAYPGLAGDALDTR